MDNEFQINPGGAFMGAHFSYETGISTTHNIAVNILHSIFHIAHTERKLCYYYGMTYADFADTNREFIDRFRIEFKKKRNYELNYSDLKSAIDQFIRRMEHLYRYM